MCVSLSDRPPFTLILFNFAVKIQKKYQNLGHKVLMVTLEKDRRGLGISLAGHKDRNRMAVFVCGLNPKGAAHKNGGIVIGDEILEVALFALLILYDSPLFTSSITVTRHTVSFSSEQFQFNSGSGLTNFDSRGCLLRLNRPS